MSDSACPVSSHAHRHRDPAWEAQMLKLLAVACKPRCTSDHPESGISADSWVPIPGSLLLDCESSGSLQCTVRRQSHSSDKIKDYPLHTHTHTQLKSKAKRKSPRHSSVTVFLGEPVEKLWGGWLCTGVGRAWALGSRMAGTPSFVCRPQQQFYSPTVAFSKRLIRNLHFQNLLVIQNVIVDNI